MKFTDYYKTLGVERDASPEDIKKAFRKLVRKHHPDLNKASDAQVKMQEINEANDVLWPMTRSHVDRLRERTFLLLPAGPMALSSVVGPQTGLMLGRIRITAISLKHCLGRQLAGGPLVPPDRSLVMILSGSL
jgi:DnaJ domain